MRLSPLLSEQLQMTLQSGIEQGLQQGIQQGIRRERRNFLESLLTFRFGTLDEPLTAIIAPLVDLPPSEFLPLLLQLSRDELLTRFGQK